MPRYRLVLGRKEMEVKVKRFSTFITTETLEKAYAEGVEKAKKMMKAAKNPNQIEVISIEVQ